MVWLVPFSSLSPEQQRAAQLDTRTHKAIIGGPGAGKTLALLHRLAPLYEKAGCNSDAVRLFVYTGTLKEFIRAGIKDLNLPDECVSTFDKWCHDAYRAWISPSFPKTADRKIDFDAIRASVHEAVRQGRIATPIFDFVLIDEAQDLDMEAMELLNRIARHITVCMDGKQQIFGKGAAESEILQSLGLTRQNAALLAAYRCNPMVTQLATRFVVDETRRAELLRQATNTTMDRSKPLLFLAGSFHEEMDNLVQSLKLRFNYGDSIAVLVPQQRQVHGLAKGLIAAGIEVEVHQRSAPIDFANRRPKLMTYHQAKGLTFDSVFMPRLVNASFPGGLRGQLERLLFVGASRAVKWVYLSGINGNLIEPLYSLWQEDSDAFLSKQLSTEAAGVFGKEDAKMNILENTPDEFGLN